MEDVSDSFNFVTFSRSPFTHCWIKCQRSGSFEARPFCVKTHLTRRLRPLHGQTWKQSVPSRGSGCVRSFKINQTRLRTHPLPRDGTDCVQASQENLCNQCNLWITLAGNI